MQRPEIAFFRDDYYRFWSPCPVSSEAALTDTPGFLSHNAPDEAYDMERVDYYRCKGAWPMERNGAIAEILIRGICPILATGALFPPIGAPCNSSAPCPGFSEETVPEKARNRTNSGGRKIAARGCEA